jgi:hypothetical protein
MATSDPGNFDKPQFDSRYLEPPRQRGCLFYGCLFSAVFAVLIMVAVGALTYIAFRGFGQIVQQYSSTTPVPLPKTEITEEDRRTLEERVGEFRKALDDGTPTAPLILTSRDLNALIESNPTLRDKIYVTIEEDKIKGQVSLPLEDFAFGPFVKMLTGRFLNGEAELTVSLKDGVLLVLLDSIEINGKRLPEDVIQQLRQQNLTKDAYKDPKNAEQIRKLESIEVKSGKVIITARQGSSTKAEPSKLPEDVIAPLGGAKSEPARGEHDTPKEPAATSDAVPKKE